MSSSSSLNPEWEPFLSSQQIIIGPMATFTASLGFYAIVFGISVRILTRQDSSASKLHLVGTITLFVLSTIFVAVDLWSNLRQSIIYFDAVRTRDYTGLSDYLDHDLGKTASGALNNILNTLLKYADHELYSPP
ncbi:hypothetical protein V5O48_011904 [Marasmius crinis-equi]|uniref:Uncharacterized protein n=1 Tax=Marasmius crinis-equi TaxID=585013 RepID=A0ABR3F4B0_9AGAR